MPVHKDYHPRSWTPCIVEMPHGTRSRPTFSSRPSSFNQCNKNGRHLSSDAATPVSSISSASDDEHGLAKIGQGALENIPTSNQCGIDNDEKTLELTKVTGYNLIQRNGQRIYGGPPPNWIGAPPTKGTEIFVGKVPRDMYEWELVPIFEKCGSIYELRLMMDFSGSNRGYLFVRYTHRDEAKRAIKELNNYEIRPGKFIGVIPSVDNRKLWISGIPKNRSADEIQDEMAKLTDGVTNVYIYSSALDKSKTRGYAFVEYKSHRHAALARRKLVPGRNFLFDQEIERVDWAEPENEVDDEVMAKVKVLFIRNLSAKTSEEDIEAYFESVSNGQIERVKKTKDYAFVHFQTREAAQEAFDKTKGHLFLDNCLIEVNWSKPIDRQIHSQRKQLTKALTCGNAATTSLMVTEPQIPVANSIPPSPLMMNILADYGRLGNMRHPLIAPRPRGAAGIRGLGAPGTPPPRNLIRQLNNANSGQYSTAMYEEMYEMMKNFGLYNAGPDSINAAAGVMAPSSPPSNNDFFTNAATNFRMLAPPPNTNPGMYLQSPFYYGGAGAATGI